MGHHSVSVGHLFAPCEAEGHDSPHTEGKAAFLSLPTPCRAQREVEFDPKHNVQAGCGVDLPPLFSPSPISPSRPKSPWGRFDPYDAAEVQ